MLNFKLLRYSFIVAALLPVLTAAAEPSLRINELAWMGTETSSNDEWIEFYNITDAAIDLTGWRIEAADGSPSIALEGTIEAGGYFLLERTDDDTVLAIAADQIYTGGLGNNGERLRLYDQNGALVDEVNGSDAWPAGDNTTKQTMQRAGTGWLTSVAVGGTPRAENDAGLTTETPDEAANDQPTAETDEAARTATTTPALAKKGDITITELFPNPIGSDDGTATPEFIELQNTSVHDVDLTDWALTTIHQQAYRLPSLVMRPGSIVVFTRSQTGLALDNRKEKVTLSTQRGTVIDQRGYSTAAAENQSYQRGTGGGWVWGETSPGKENVATQTTYPEAFISGPTEGRVGQLLTFDGSDSFDPQYRALTFTWRFGDGRVAAGLLVRQIYSQPGKYEVLLTVTAADVASTTEKLKITVAGETTRESTTTPTTTEPVLDDAAPALTEIPFIFISEFLPNPEGADQAGEFIELFNQEQRPVDLAGWQLDDAEGGSRPFMIPAGTVIKPGQYLAFPATETRLALNNDTDAVRLLAPGSALIDYVEYEDVKEGESMVLDEQFNWQKSATPTPGEINVLDATDVPTATTTSTSTKPAVLGASTKEITATAEPTDSRNRYLVAGLSALAVLGMGAAAKVWRR